MLGVSTLVAASVFGSFLNESKEDKLKKRIGIAPILLMVENNRDHE